MFFRLPSPLRRKLLVFCVRLAVMGYIYYISFTIYEVGTWCCEPVWPVHNNTSSRWSLLQVQGTDFAVRWLITLSTALHSTVISPCFVKFQGSGDNQGLESFLSYEFYFSFIFFAIIGRSYRMVSKSIARLNSIMCWNVWRRWHSLNHYFFFVFLAFMPRTGTKKFRASLSKANRNRRRH